MTLDSLAEMEGVTWEVCLWEFKLWLDARRQKESFATFSEALTAWVNEKQEMADRL